MGISAMESGFSSQNLIITIFHIPHRTHTLFLSHHVPFYEQYEKNTPKVLANNLTMNRQASNPKRITLKIVITKFLLVSKKCVQVC